MLEPIYTKDVWQGYTNYMREVLDRLLTEKEIKDALQAYIHGVKVDEHLEGMGGKK